ncbi:MAG: protein phosphatase 2C domain-containing protein [Candidatus Omnitrophica bacterium]|nr:protein phosphatase 2C domain-containing protein [Candidatus Omnitrophota bacterium]
MRSSRKLSLKIIAFLLATGLAPPPPADALRLLSPAESAGLKGLTKALLPAAAPSAGLEEDHPLIPGTDFTPDLSGPHPFESVRIFAGPNRFPSYIVGEDHSFGAHLIQTPSLGLIVRAQDAGLPLEEAMDAAVRHFDEFEGREDALSSLPAMPAEAIPVDELAAISADDADLIRQLKQMIDDAGMLPPRTMIRGLFSHLAGADGSYSPLLTYVNRVLADPRRKPGKAPALYIESVDEIRDLELWFVKEGSSSIVVQVQVRLKDQPADAWPIRFAANVGRDVTDSAASLRETYDQMIDDYDRDPHVMEIYALGTGRVEGPGGAVEVPVLVGEWLEDAHELHLDYETGWRFRVWMDQDSAKAQTLSEEDSLDIWRQILRLRTIYSLLTERPAISWPQINAGDFVARKNPDGRWEVFLIWDRPSPVDPESSGAVTAISTLLQAVSDVDPQTGDIRFVWFKRPDVAVEAFVEALYEQIGFIADRSGVSLSDEELDLEIRALLESVYDVHLPYIFNNPSVLISSWGQLTEPHRSEAIQAIAATHEALADWLATHQAGLEESSFEKTMTAAGVMADIAVLQAIGFQPVQGDGYGVVPIGRRGGPPVALLVVVTDALGGKDRPDVAGPLAVELITSAVQQDDLLLQFLETYVVLDPKGQRTLEPIIVERLQGLLQRVHVEMILSPDEMGSTAVFALVAGRTAFVPNVGDSRAYRLSGDRLELLTLDHNEAWKPAYERLRDLWEAEPTALAVAEQARKEEGGYTLYQYLGRLVRPDLHVHWRVVHLRPGDRFLLATDGVTNQVSGIRIGQVLRDRSLSAMQAVNLLMEEARAGRDNRTATVIDIRRLPPARILTWKQEIGSYPLNMIFPAGWSSKTNPAVQAAGHVLRLPHNSAEVPLGILQIEYILSELRKNTFEHLLSHEAKNTARLRILLETETEAQPGQLGWFTLEYRDENPESWKVPIDTAVRTPGLTSKPNLKMEFGYGLSSLHRIVTALPGGTLSVEGTDPGGERRRYFYESPYGEPATEIPEHPLGTKVTVRLPLGRFEKPFSEITAQISQLIQDQAGLEQQPKVWTLQQLADKGVELAAVAQAQQYTRAVLVLAGIPAPALESSGTLFAHASVSAAAWSLLPEGWVAPENLFDIPVEKSSEMLARAVAEFGKNQSVVIALEQGVPVDLQQFEERPPALLLNSQTWHLLMRQEYRRVLAVILTQPRLMTNLILDLTKGSIQRVTIDGVDYFAVFA